jgi:FMN phosphatase YigB (HAD superfamily)
MLRAVLFDLDDTLLGNSMDVFLPAYFEALIRYLDHLVPPERLMSELMRATGAMNANRDECVTNEEAFASAFYSALEPDRSMLELAFERFYAEEFPRLQRLTRRRSEARALVAQAVKQELQVAVATNPLFPRIAVEQRLAWADVPVDEFRYALVTTYENMHATKSSSLYYLEILERLGVQSDEALMVGDSWDMDIAPASSVGLHVYWINEQDELPTTPPSLLGHGSLSELWAWVEARGWALQAD